MFILKKKAKRVPQLSVATLRLFTMELKTKKVPHYYPINALLARTGDTFRL